MKKRNINFAAVVAAAAAGGGYELAIQGAAKRVDFINENYLVTKSLIAGLLGSGMLYFGGADEKTKAAGYALLGVGGASGASKISTVIVTSGGAPMNGARRQRIRNILTRRRPDMEAARSLLRAGRERNRGILGNLQQRPGAMPQASMQMQPRATGREDNALDFSGLINFSALYGV